MKPTSQTQGRVLQRLWAYQPVRQLARAMGVWERRHRNEFAYDRERSDVLVVSIPKSGRTWHRLMLGYYLARSCGEAEDRALKLVHLCRKARTKRVSYSHNGVSFLDWLPASSPVVASPELWSGKEVLLLVRDPRDVLVSAYHHYQFRTATFQRPISDFIRRPETGIAKLMTAHHRWHDNRRFAASFQVASYECMHQDPNAVLRQTLSLIGLTEVDEALIGETVEFCRFEKMQQYEATDRFGSARLRNESGDARSAKVREGRVGSYRSHLSQEDQSFIDDYIGRAGDPFAEPSVDIGAPVLSEPDRTSRPGFR